MQNHSSTMQLTSPISSENLMQSRLGELGFQSIDVGGAGDCFFSGQLLIGCGKKWEILRHFQGKLYDKKGLLCGKLCD